MNKVQKVAISAGLALALTVGFGTTAKSAWAGYLTAPTLSTTPLAGGFEFNVNGGGTYYYATGNSSYGNTLPTTSAISALSGISRVITISDGVNSTGGNVPTFFTAPSGLNTTPVATMTNPYSMSSGGTTVSGDVISNVFKFGATPGISGAHPGELVFTYQFDITGVASLNNTGIYAASIADFNNPNGTAFTLGSGINTTAIGPSFAGDTYVNGSGQTVALTQTLITPSDLTGNVSFATNGTVSALGYNSNADILLGEYSPQFFVASNAYNFSMGTIGFTGSGLNGGAAVFVPGTPEPKTLILFGSGIALLAFMFRRKQENTLSI
jgi:hypothetical protein